MDLRKPGEEEDEYSETAEEAMDPDNCFPDCKLMHTTTEQHCRGSFRELEFSVAASLLNTIYIF